MASAIYKTEVNCLPELVFCSIIIDYLISLLLKIQYDIDEELPTGTCGVLVVKGER